MASSQENFTVQWGKLAHIELHVVHVLSDECCTFKEDQTRKGAVQTGRGETSLSGNEVAEGAFWPFHTGDIHSSESHGKGGR